MKAVDFQNIIKSVIFAAEGSSRYQLRCVAVNTTPEGTFYCATNGRSMAYITDEDPLTLIDVARFWPQTIPNDKPLDAPVLLDLADLRKLSVGITAKAESFTWAVDHCEPETVGDLEYSNRCITFAWDLPGDGPRRFQTVRILTGRYPNVQDPIATVANLEAIGELRAYPHHIIDMFTPERFSISYNGDQTTCQYRKSDTHEIYFDGYIDVTFDPKLLIPWLRTLPKRQNATILFHGPEQPIFASAQGGITSKFIFMPMNN